jgi:hypothetical protein
MFRYRSRRVVVSCLPTGPISCVVKEARFGAVVGLYLISEDINKFDTRSNSLVLRGYCEGLAMSHSYNKCFRDYLGQEVV